MAASNMTLFPWCYTQDDLDDKRQAYRSVAGRHTRPPTPDLPELLQKDSALVFVYGTLMSGKKNQHYLKDAKYISRGVTDSSYFQMYQTTHGMPFVMSMLGQDSEHNKHVAGEVYRVSVEDLCRLDILEANGTMYIRVQQKIHLVGELEGYKLFPCFMYLGLKKTWEPAIQSHTVVRCPSYKRTKTDQPYYAYTFPFKGRG